MLDQATGGKAEGIRRRFLMDNTQIRKQVEELVPKLHEDTLREIRKE